jgi:hypothetical protein
MPSFHMVCDNVFTFLITYIIVCEVADTVSTVEPVSVFHLTLREGPKVFENSG